MKAFIMAAGFGTRLEPLTLAVPKPMVYVANRPIMQHNLELLKKHGIVDICANIHYFPEQIEAYFGSGSEFGVKLSYSYEESLLGTAGGVRKMAEISGGVDDTFVVLSSDALTDIDLDSLVAFHKRKGAIATIALYSVLDTSHFGVVVLDDKDKVTAFQEKPPVGKALTNLANTGIYIFEPEIMDLIPKNQFYDFGQQLFPRLVKGKKELYGYCMNEYWSDVGNLEQYTVANFDVLNQNIQTPMHLGQNEEGIWIGDNVLIGKDVVLEPPMILGDGVQILDGSHIVGPTIIGDKTVVSGNSRITRSIIWSEVTIGAHCAIDESIIGCWCQLQDRVKIGVGSVLANRCRISKGSVVAPESRIKPNGHI
jgi:NDP-sugar pyrophosphorylase family protein